jgi:TM2 domain-containing membrane protein YozV
MPGITLEAMASSVLCGRCGSPLPSPTATCPRCGASPSQGYTTRRAAVGRKNPTVAALLAIVPGMGHVYLGQNLKGLFFLLACGGLEFVGVDLDLTVVGGLLGVPLGAGGFGLYVFQLWDAYREAKKIEAEFV